MKKTLRTVVATLLMLVMLFSVSVTTIFAAGSSVAGGSGSVAPIPPSGGNSGNSVNLGNWISVGYDDDSIDIVWYHMIGAMLETMSYNPEKIEELSDILTEAIENLIIKPTEEGMIGGKPGSGDVVISDVSNISVLWDTALDTYLSKHSDKYGTDKSAATIAFFKAVMNEDINAANSIARDFTDYVCTLIKLGVRASSDPEAMLAELKEKVKITVGTTVLEGGEALKARLDDEIHSTIEEYAKETLENEVEVYVTKLQNHVDGEPLVLTDLQKLIQTEALEYARNEVLAYLNGELTDFDSQISSFIENEAEAEAKRVVTEVLGKYAAIKKGTEAPYAAGTPEAYAYDEIDAYVKLAVENYVKTLCSVPVVETTLLDYNTTLRTKLDTVFNSTLEGEFDDIANYIEAGMTGTQPTGFPVFKDTIETKFGVSIDAVPVDELRQKKAEVIAEVKTSLTPANHNDIVSLLGTANDLIAKVDESELDSAIANVTSDDLDDVLNGVVGRLDNDTLKDLAAAVSDDEIVSLLTKVVKTSGYDVETIITAVEDEVANITITDDHYDTAYKQLFENDNIDKATVDGKIVSLENILASSFDSTLVELENDPELEIADLLTYLQSMTVTAKVGDVVGTPKNIYVFENGKATLKSDAVKALIKELPLPAEVANMEADDMKLSFTVEIVTDFSEVKFDINISVGNNYDKVREFAKALTELITVSRADGKLTLTLDLFENTADVLNSFINSDKLSPELKSELFGLIGLSVEELYDYVNDRNEFTYSKYKSIISAIDFEAIFKNFGIENEPNGYKFDYNGLMVKILCQDEEKFEDVRTKLLDAFDSVPENLKTKTIFNLYEGDGKFSYFNSGVKIPVSALINKVGSSIPALGTFMPLIVSLAGNRVIESDIEINVNGPKLYRVTYVVEDPVTGANITKTGLLPEGVSVHGMFSPIEMYSGTAIERYDGYRIEKWSNADGETVETVPAGDVVLYATLEKVKAEIKVYDDNGRLKDGEELKNGVLYGESSYYRLEANVIYTSSTHLPLISYQWYKGQTLLVGKTGKTLDITANVASTGDYWCKVTIESDGDLNNVSVNSVAQTITVNPRPVDMAGYGLEWNYDPESPFTYDGAFHSVTLTYDSLTNVNNKGLPAIIPAPDGFYTGIENSEAGVYYARAYFIFEDAELRANYALVSSDGTVAYGEAGYVQCEWEIKPQAIDSFDGFEWSIEDGDSFVYEYGTTYSVELNLPAGLVVESYDNEAATNAGSYTTVAYVKSSDPNYEWVGGDVSINWSIEKQLFDLAENVIWDYDSGSPFVYNASEQGINVTGVPADIVWIYSGNVATTAGNYIASVEPDPNNALNNQNYIFKGEAPTCMWTIEKQSIESLLALGWNYKEAFTYNGEAFTVELNLPEGFDERIVVVYKDNSATNAGSYTAKAELVALDSENFEVVGDPISFECAWVINKAVIDMSGISFKDKIVTETGEPIGIEIKGTLPAGVFVEYSEPAVEVGEYEMVATFIYDEENYEAIAPMTAKLTIKPYYPDVKEFERTDASGNLLVDITAGEKGVPSNYELNVNDLTAQYYGYDFGNLFGYGTNGKVLAVYDIHFAENGTETPVYDVFTVKLRIPETFDGNINNVRVVYIDDNGEVVDMEAMIVDGNYVAYETIHFSVYAIVEVVERVEESNKLDLMEILPYAIAALAVLLLLIIIIVVIKKKRKKNKPEEPVAKEEPKPEEPKPEEPLAAEAVPEEEPLAEEEPAPVEEEKPSIVIHDSVEDIVTEEAPLEEGAEPVLPPEIVHVRCRSSFTSRLIQSEPPIQDYYTILKNALLSYKGVKARMSFNFESFNSGRVQCAKLNVKGKSFLVYLGLDLSEYNVNKYHFSDASDKPKFEKVPMMLKVKSDRSLKYALELIEEVMKKNGFEKDPKFQEQDYHMPYETTAALAEKELVKLILPQGVSLADGIKLVKMDVGALLEEAKSGDDDED